MHGLIKEFAKKIRHNVFSLSRNGCHANYNFLSDILTSLANSTDHRLCESKDVTSL